MVLKLEGILPAMITPFGDDGGIDEAALSALVERLVSAGVGGLIPAGSTGEFTALSGAERRQLTEVVVREAGGRVPVVPHTGGLTTEETVELSKHAEQAGASAVMVVPPFYEAPQWDELVDHYRAVSDAISIPVMIYNIPSATGIHLSADQIGVLADIPGVSFIKDSSSDAVLLTELLQRYGDRIEIFNGWDSLTFYGLAAGAKASVWGAANFIPELTVALFDALAVRGDLEEGRALWQKIWPICNVLENRGYVRAVKAGCELVGITAGKPRRPYQPLPDTDVQMLAAALKGAGVALG